MDLQFTLIDFYYVFNIPFKQAHHCFNVELMAKLGCNTMLDDFTDNIYLNLHHYQNGGNREVPNDYYFAYYTQLNQLALFRAYTPFHEDYDFGYVDFSSPSDDSIFYRTNNEGLFEFFGFNNLRSREAALSNMIRKGAFDGHLSTLRSASLKQSLTAEQKAFLFKQL